MKSGKRIEPTGQPWTEHDIKRVLLDPRYAGVGGYPPICDDATWIGGNIKLMNELGPENYFRELLDALHIAFALDAPIPFGYREVE